MDTKKIAHDRVLEFKLYFIFFLLFHICIYYISLSCIFHRIHNFFTLYLCLVSEKIKKNHSLCKCISAHGIAVYCSHYELCSRTLTSSDYEMTEIPDIHTCTYTLVETQWQNLLLKSYVVVLFLLKKDTILLYALIFVLN